MRVVNYNPVQETIIYVLNSPDFINGLSNGIGVIGASLGGLLSEKN